MSKEQMRREKNRAINKEQRSGTRNKRTEQRTEEGGQGTELKIYPRNRGVGP